MSKAEERPGKGSGDRAVVDHVAEELVDRNATADEPTVHSPTTEDGKPIAEQVHKQWDPKKRGGLPTFLK
jgi:hypothetical protein